MISKTTATPIQCTAHRCAQRGSLISPSGDPRQSHGFRWGGLFAAPVASMTGWPVGSMKLSSLLPDRGHFFN
jgi:hypothetical protein